MNLTLTDDDSTVDLVAGGWDASPEAGPKLRPQDDSERLLVPKLQVLSMDTSFHVTTLASIIAGLIVFESSVSPCLIIRARRFLMAVKVARNGEISAGQQ